MIYGLSISLLFQICQDLVQYFLHQLMTLTSPLTVVAIMNGMIGGVILVLPVSSHQAGYVFTILAIIFSGGFSYYSCFLSIKHLGDQKDMNYAMQAHFGNHRIAKIIYDVVVWLGLLLGSMFYYGLICLQWESITGRQSIVIPLLNTAVIFFLIFVLKYFDFGASLMAYGIISIFAYMIFLIWVIASAPSGQTNWKPIGTNLYQFGATMSLAFAIQAFFIPVLMKNPSQGKHTFLTLLAYIIGACIYVYISFMGSFGIMNRSPLSNDPQTIQDYFKSGNVQLKIIECIYLVHLYSCLPQFVLISKKRFFNALKIQETNKGKIPLRQIIYSSIFLGLCLLIRLLGVKIDTIIAINGAIIGFFNIYFFPVVLHIKCLYFSDDKKPLKQEMKLRNDIFEKYGPQRVSLQMRETQNLSLQQQTHRQSPGVLIQLKDPMLNNYPQFSSEGQSQKQSHNRVNLLQSLNHRNFDELKNQQVIKRQDVKKTGFEQKKDQNNRYYFLCDCKKPQRLIVKILQIILQLIMVALGAAIMVNGLISVI